MSWTVSWRWIAIGAWLLCPSLSTAMAGVVLSKEDALQKAFSGAEVERHVVALSEEQVKAVGILSGSKRNLSDSVVLYEGKKEGRIIGTAYIDSHRVHSLPQTLMVVVGPDSRIASLDVLAFDEPAKFRASAKWLDLFRGRGLDDDLQLGQGIQGITGATLTARSTTRVVRRILAIHRVLNP
ncbi:MAG: FMN-binding protein [Kiritimatiellae bacterium]|nr:FMN-binding protein [Kiritimatiellia bacterium]